MPQLTKTQEVEFVDEDSRQTALFEENGVPISHIKRGFVVDRVNPFYWLVEVNAILYNVRWCDQHKRWEGKRSE